MFTKPRLSRCSPRRFSAGGKRLSGARKACAGCALAVSVGGLILAPRLADAAPVLQCREMQATLVGTPGPDSLTGTDGPDVIVALGGNDVINGLGGEDRICAGDGQDTVNGGQGWDWIEGGDGDDVIDGQEHHDWLEGGSGDDRILGDSGIQSLGESDHLFGGEGNDTLKGTQGDDFIDGQAGDDSLLGGTGNDYMTGSEGADKLDYAPRRPADARMRRRLLRSLSGDDRLIGGPGADRMGVRFAAVGTDELHGMDGNDTLRGLPPDSCSGGAGADSVKCG